MVKLEVTQETMRTSTEVMVTELETRARKQFLSFLQL